MLRYILLFVLAGCAADSALNNTPDAETASGGQAPDATAQPVPASISPEELSRHNSAADCWVAYDGRVYDITAWLPRHPGTSNAITPHCGTAEEFTAAFTQMHGVGKVARLKVEGTDMGAYAG